MPKPPGEAESKRAKAVAERRALILEAAVSCFLEKGYHQTGVRDIARQAGVSLGNLYNHFPGKHDVLVEIAALERDEMTQFLEIFARPAAAGVVLGDFLRAYGLYLAQPENVLLAIEITSEALRKPDIGERFMANRFEIVGALEAVLRRGIEDGEFRAMPNPHQMSHLIVDMLDGGAYQSILSEADMSKLLEDIEDFVFAAVRRH